MKVSTITLGCKVNQYETQAMLNQLLQGGFSACQTGEDADIILLNKYLLSKAFYPIREDLKVNVDIDYNVDEESLELIIMFCKRTGKKL